MHSKLFDWKLQRRFQDHAPGLARTIGAETMLWASDATWVAMLRGFLANDPTIPTTAAGAAFRDGLSKGGFVEGDNILIDWRFAAGRADRYAELASTL